MEQDYVLAFDLGGTKIAAGTFGMDGAPLGEMQRVPTMTGRKTAVTLMNLKRAGLQAQKAAALSHAPRCIGVGSAGPLDAASGVLRNPDTLPNLMDFRINAFLEAEFGAPAYLENDAACFVLGEALGGAGRGHAHVAGVTLGTGFGLGLVIGGAIFRGATGNAGEVMYCPTAGGTWDEMLTGGGVSRYYARISGEEGVLGKDVGDRAEAGEAAALRTWREWGTAVGEALGVIAAIVDPSVIVLGGSLAMRRGLFDEPMMARMKTHMAPSAAAAIAVKTAELGSAAGVVGAALHAVRSAREAGA